MSSQSRKINLRVPKAVSIVCFIALAGCVGPPVVPVSDLSATQSSGSTRIVRAGDSLYIISWEAGLDYRDVALWNGLQPPYALTVGQKIELSPGRINAQNTIVTPAADSSTSILVVSDEPAEASETLTDPDAQEYEQENEKEEPVAGPDGKPWIWPANGELLSQFSPDDGRNGIDIAGADGSPIRAAAKGKVVYAGTGLRGYGLLVIIKHDETFLTAYAHNRAVKINEGDAVESGQIIAVMGQSGTDSVRLHFEIRRDGQPVDPLEYLPDA